MLKLDEMYDVWWKLTGIWLEYDVELDEMSWDVWCFESVGTTLSFVKIRWNELRCMMYDVGKYKYGFYGRVTV